MQQYLRGAPPAHVKTFDELVIHYNRELQLLEMVLEEYRIELEALRAELNQVKEIQNGA